MSITRSNPVSLALSPLPAMYIWSSTNSEFTTLCEQARSKETEKYLRLLQEYRARLNENNPIYDNKSTLTESAQQWLIQIQEYINNLSPEQTELYAACENLRGLYLKNIVKDAEKAHDVFSSLYNNLRHELSLLSAVVALCNKASVAQEISGQQAEVKNYYQQAEADIKNLPQAGSQAYQHVLAAILSNIASFKRQTSLPSAVNIYMQAQQLWPQSNVIANNTAISLSKIRDLEKLKQADAILFSFYDEAIANNKFVNPYYRADINLKIALILSEDNKDFNKYIINANQLLSLASNILCNNAGYSNNYKKKGQARIEHLQAVSASLQGNMQKAQEYLNKSTEQRQNVEEKENKKIKFQEKFFDVTKGVSSMHLFRQHHNPTTNPDATENQNQITLSK